MSVRPSPTRKQSRKERTEAMIERCRNAKVVLLNEPDPVRLRQFFHNYLKSLTPANFKEPVPA